MRNRNMQPRRVRAVAAGLACALLPANSFANEPLPTIFAIGLPVWLGFFTLSLSLAAVVSIEGAVLRRVARWTWRDSLWAAFRANFFTTLLGFLLIAHPLELFGLLLIPIAAYRGLAHRMQWKPGAAIAAAAGLLIATIAILILGIQPTVPRLIVHFYITLIFGGFLSFWFEALSLARTAVPRLAWQYSLRMNAASYFCLFLFLLAGGFRSGGAINYYLIESRILSDPSRSREEIVVQLEEMYGLADSTQGARLAIFQSKNRETYDFQAAGRLQKWLSEGDGANSLRLYEVMKQYRRLSPEGSWGEAEVKEIEAEIGKLRGAT